MVCSTTRKKIIEDIKPDIIFSTSPPPTTSLIAKKLADWSNIPWIADFRDPWTNIYYYDEHPQSKYAQKKNKKIEFDTLTRADQITVVNEGFSLNTKKYFDQNHQNSKWFRSRPRS